MRRLLSIAMLSFLLSALLAVFALPGFATEAEAPEETTEHAEDADADAEHAEDADEEGLWLGLQGALAAAVAFGAFAFFVSGTDGLGGDGHH